MNTLFFFIASLLLFNSCYQNKEEVKHIFYLHGRIIEIQGINAESEQFGKYKYQEIIDSLSAIGGIVHNEIRTVSTDYNSFCQSLSDEIDALISQKVNPQNITIIGASKGAVMAMNISHMNEHPINYILLGANSDYLEKEKNWTLHGRILGIYEKSDRIAGKDYQYWIKNSKEIVKFEEIELNTGLGHGFLYSPIEEWLGPTKEWINHKH